MYLGHLMSMEERIVLNGAIVADAVDDSADDDVVTGAPAFGQPETAGKVAEASNANSGSNAKNTTGTTAQPNQPPTLNNARSAEQNPASDLQDTGAQAELNALLINTDMEEFEAQIQADLEQFIAGEVYARTRATGKDLIIESINYSGNTFTGNGMNAVAIQNITVKNNGTEAIGSNESFKLTFRLSTTNDYDSAEHALAGTNGGVISFDLSKVGGLAAGASLTIYPYYVNENTISFTYPSINGHHTYGTPDGNYYLVAKIDSEESITETDENNNTWISSSPYIVIDTDNHAPVLGTHYTPRLEPQVVNETSPSGTLVSDIIQDGSITDLDGVTKGMAVTSVDNTCGYWEYSLDNGNTWLRFTETSGGVVHLDRNPGGGALADAGKARLLDGNAMIRFAQSTAFVGDVTFTFQAWDMSDGKTSGATGNPTSNGGTTAFSSQWDVAVLTITDALNQPPTVDAIPDTSFDQSGQFSYNVSGYFHDEPGDSLSFTFKCYNEGTNQWETPQWLRMTANGELYGNPSVSDGGTLRLTVTATDRAGNRVDSTPFKLVLGGNSSVTNNLNDVPQLNGRITDTVYNSSLNQPIGSLGFSDPDMGDRHNYSLSGSGKDMFTISNGMLILKAGTPVGVYELVIGVIDSNGAIDSRTVSITVEEVPPTQNVENQPKTEATQLEESASDERSSEQIIYNRPSREEAQRLQEEQERLEAEKEARREEREWNMQRLDDVYEAISYLREYAEDAVRNGNLTSFLWAYNMDPDPRNLTYGDPNSRMNDYLLTITSEEFNNLISVKDGWFSRTNYIDENKNITMLPPGIFSKLPLDVLLGIPPNALTYMSSEQIAVMIDTLNTYYSNPEQVNDSPIPAELIVFLYVREIQSGDIVDQSKNLNAFYNAMRDSKQAQNSAKINDAIAAIVNGANYSGFEDVCNVFGSVDGILAEMQKTIDSAVNVTGDMVGQVATATSIYGDFQIAYNIVNGAIEITAVSLIETGVKRELGNVISKVVVGATKIAIDYAYNQVSNPGKFIANRMSGAHRLAVDNIEDVKSNLKGIY